MVCQAPYDLRIKRCFFVCSVNKLTKFAECNRNPPRHLLGFQPAEILQRHVCKTAAAGHCRCNQTLYSVQNEISALKGTHENVNRNAAPECSQRFGSTQPNGRTQKNKKIGTALKANINNDWQTTSAGQKRL